jgi:hypothetical protein
MSTLSQAEETASTLVTQVSKGLPFAEQMVSMYFPQGPLVALVMQIIGENVLPGLAKALHELATVNAGNKPDDITADDVIKAGIQLQQHNNSDFANSPVLAPSIKKGN